MNPVRVSLAENEMYRLLVQGVTDYAIYMINPDGTVANWNSGAERNKGYTAAEIVGKHFSCFYPQTERDSGAPQKALEIARESGRFEAEGWRLRKNGTTFWAHVVIDPIYDDNKVFIGFTKITRDCTTQRMYALELQHARDSLKIALANIEHGVFMLDENERFVTQNAQAVEMLGLKSGMPIIGRTLCDIVGDTFASQIREHQLVPARGIGHAHRHEYHRDNRIWLATTRALVSGGWVCSIEDVTERRHVEHRVYHSATHDQLTELCNRTSMMGRLGKIFEDTKEPSGALIYLDLDHFKAVNDTLGHGAGDIVLKAVADRLVSNTRLQDTVSRLGGDEFAILMPGRTGRTVATFVAERCRLALERPIMIDQTEVSIGGSFGIALIPFDGGSPETVLRNADLALYEAKRRGRNRVDSFHLDLSVRQDARRSMEKEIRSAIEHQQFDVYFQPIVNVGTGRVEALEALLRWNLPDGTAVAPSQFIPIAEEIGLMRDIGRFVLERACAVAAQWPREIGVAVNISVTQFSDPELVSIVMHSLAKADLAPHRLEIEITETAMIQNLTDAQRILNLLRENGVSIALDDFGTGYSSLSFLNAFPLNRIKLDRSFINNVASTPRAQAIVRAVVGLCNELRLEVTAEGVESPDDLAFLSNEACSHVQGYLISRPLPSHAIEKFIAHNQLLHGGDFADQPQQVTGKMSAENGRLDGVPSDRRGTLSEIKPSIHDTSRYVVATPAAVEEQRSMTKNTLTRMQRAAADAAVIASV